MKDKLGKATDLNGKPLGMAWYKFLIYFALIAGAIINIIYSFNYISGSIYFVETNGEVSAEQVYAYYGTGLQVVDVLYGFFLIAFAILAFVVRHKLANYEPDSLKFVKIFYSISAGVPFLYAILVSAITGQSLAVQAVTSAISGLVFLLLNIKYFKKRAHLFVDKTVSTQPHSQVKQQPQREHKTKDEKTQNQALSEYILKKCKEFEDDADDLKEFLNYCLKEKYITALQHRELFLKHTKTTPLNNKKDDNIKICLSSKDTPITENSMCNTVLLQNSDGGSPAIPEKPAIMFCRKCGTKLYKDSIFCHKCGTKIIPDIT